VGDIQTAAGLIKDIGFPILAALLVAAGFWLVLKFMMSQLLNKIDGIYKRLDQQKKEIDAELNQHHKILIGIIDRVRIMDNDLIRLDTTVRLLNQLEVDLERLGRREANAQRRD
jgi:hypothetical protein